MNKYITSSGDIETKDIMYTLLMSIAPAVEMLGDRPPFCKYLDNDEIAMYAANHMRNNVKYLEDGIMEQNIKLPNALFESGFGDCKSFSLYIAAFLTLCGVKNGFKFVSYAPGDFTHVYNYYFDNKNNIVFLDSCLDDFMENPNYVKSELMEVSIIGKTPIAHKTNVKINGIGNVFDRIILSAPRAAFRALVALNYRGFASAFDYQIQNGAGPFIDIWYIDLGGNASKLRQSIEAGKNKQPLFGRGNAADVAFAQTVVAENTQSQLQVLELINNARLLGGDFPQTTYNLENPQIFATVVQALISFYTSLGVETESDLQGLLNLGQGKNNPDLIRDLNSDQPIRIGVEPVTTTGGGVTVGTIIGYAAPILLILPTLLETLGVDPDSEFMETLTNVNNALSNRLPSNTGLDPSTPDSDDLDLSSLLTLPNLLLFGGLAYIIFKRK